MAKFWVFASQVYHDREKAAQARTGNALLDYSTPSVHLDTEDEGCRNYKIITERIEQAYPNHNVFTSGKPFTLYYYDDDGNEFNPFAEK